MRQILAAVIPGPERRLEVQPVPEPDLEIDSALLEVELSEVCGTDVYLQEGRLEGVRYPLIPGHVSVGRLAKIRGRLQDVQGKSFREGDRVTFLDVHRTCNACWYCLVARATTRCPHRKVYGITYGLQDGLCGGWAQYLYLKPETKCIGLKDVDPEHFMAGGCSLPTALHVMDRSGISLGESVLVLGAGPVGLSCVILARASGAGRVLCLGAPEARLEIAGKVGADSVLNFEKRSEEEREAWVLDHTFGRGADLSIEATGSPAAVVQAMRWTRDSGRVIVVGQYTDHGDISFNPHRDLNRKHLEVRGCWGSDFSHFYRGVELMADSSRSSAWGHLNMERFGLGGAQSAVDRVKSGQVAKALIDPWLP